MLESYPLFQHAYFVRDVRKSCEEWSKLFGAGPFVVTEHHKAEEFTYRGTDVEADVTYAFGYLGDLMIQFIQQHDDQPSIYRDMYAEGEEGFQSLISRNWQILSKDCCCYCLHIRDLRVLDSARRAGFFIKPGLGLGFIVEAEPGNLCTSHFLR